MAASRPIWTAFLTGLLREIVAQERFQPLNNPEDGGTITQKTPLGARGERGELGWLRKNEVPALDRNGYRSTKPLAKQKAGAKKIAKALNRTPGATTVKAHMHMLDVSLSTRG